MDTILLVEDADSLRETLVSLLESEKFAVDAHASAESALAALKQRSYACIVSDFKLPKRNGLDLLADLREHSQQVPFILMTAYGSIEIAVEAMKRGANDFITKPFDPAGFCSSIRQVIKHRRIVDRGIGRRNREERWFLSKNPQVQEVLHSARKVARVDTSVLILGESGTGKELMARYIHDQSPRRNKPFIAVNCGAIPPELLESEFFGHDAGAFTGATQSRIGVMELASEGTLFLDEIGEMPPALQVKLLRALQEQEIKRLGGTKTISIAPRIISATNQNIETCLSEGTLREDLYYRIAVVSLTIPPLRERPEDVPLLAEHYIRHFCEKIGKHTVEVDEATRAVLQSHQWPGNARELENTMERAVILADQVIEPRHLELSRRDTEKEASRLETLPEAALKAVTRAERELIQKTLLLTQGNKSKAAQLLDVSYKTLLNKIKEYGLTSSDADDHGARS